MTNGNRKIKTAARKIAENTGLKYTEAKRLAEVMVPESDEARQIVEHLVSGLDYEFSIKTKDGITERVLIVSGQLGYFDAENPTYANIVTAKGDHIEAWDEGTQFDYRFKDGGERKTWVVPLLNGDDLAADFITSGEFDVLERLDGYLHETFFSDNLPDAVSALLDAEAEDGDEDEAAHQAVVASATYVVNTLMKRRREIGIEG